MTALLSPSPAFLGRSFPRSNQELYILSRALGSLQEQLEQGLFGLVLTDAYELFVENFDWERVASVPLLREFVKIVGSWLTRGSDLVVRVDVDPVSVFRPHPSPEYCAADGDAGLWSEQIGKLLTVHDEVAKDGFFIGIACCKRFAGEAPDIYGSSGDRQFPLVGPDQVRALGDSETWWLPPNIHNIPVPYASARRNLHVLGGEVSSVAEGSHFKVRFSGAARSWPLDCKYDPLIERHIDELADLLALPRNVVRFGLLYGCLPDKRSRLEQWRK
jgi:hypothetical protein